MATTFAVDAVTAVTSPLPRRPWQAAARDVLGARVDVVSHHAAVVVDCAARPPHPLLGAVHRAFAAHRPLRLSPDDLWLTIAQGLALHVDQNAEALRHRFVRHRGQKILRHTHPSAEPPRDAAAWSACIDGLVDVMGDDLGPGVTRLLRCDFSTSTPITRTASHVVALAAFRAFYDYRIECSCGIPTVTLDGTVDDWRAIRARVDVVGEFDCGWWADPLRLVCDQFVAAARGDVDVDFWRSIYKPRKDYDRELCTGWLSALFPYVQHDDQRVERSPAFLSWSKAAPWSFAGLLPAQTPSGFARVALLLEPMQRPVVVYGGFGGVAQDDDGALRPLIVWGVGDDVGGAGAVDRLLSSKKTQAQPPTTTPPWLRGAVADFYDRCGGLRCGDVVIRGVAGLVHNERADAYVFADLDDGRVCAVDLGGRPRVYVLRRDTVELEDIHLVAHDIGDFFDLVAARDAGAPWQVLGDAYQHAERPLDALRRLLRTPGPPVKVLDDDEGWRLTCLLGMPSTAKMAKLPNDPALHRFWFECLRLSYGFSETADAFFGAPRKDAQRHLAQLCRLAGGTGRKRPP